MANNLGRIDDGSTGETGTAAQRTALQRLGKIRRRERRKGHGNRMRGWQAALTVRRARSSVLTGERPDWQARVRGVGSNEVRRGDVPSEEGGLSRRGQRDLVTVSNEPRRTMMPKAPPAVRIVSHAPTCRSAMARRRKVTVA